ncbi:MAG TPA: hypothetical protein VGF14_06750 [Alphaproteobacteria bacterium]
MVKEKDNSAQAQLRSKNRAMLILLVSLILLIFAGTLVRITIGH